LLRQAVSRIARREDPHANHASPNMPDCPTYLSSGAKSVKGFLVPSNNDPPALGKQNQSRLNSIKRPTDFLEFHQTALQEIRPLGKTQTRMNFLAMREQKRTPKR
jgi:hypothetical protein